MLTSVRFSRITPIIALALLLLPLVQIALPVFASPATTLAPLVGSWNPNVSCTPTIARITDITVNQTGITSFNNSPFSPGITTTISGGNAKRWLTPGPTPSGWNSPGPACTITNNFGKQQGVFAEIDGVKRASAVFEDSSTRYDPTNGGGSYGGATVNDFTFNIYDPAVVSNYATSCTSASDPTCYGRIHLEIDHDWQAAKYCGSGAACDPNALSSQTTEGATLIDFQGFVYWDDNNVNSAGHSFSGWELHPVTGWRIHQTSLIVGITSSPSSPVTGQAVTFTGTASGGTSPYTFSWNFGDGATVTGNPAAHTYSTAASYAVQLSVTDSKGATGTASTTITVTGTPPKSVTVASDAASGPSSLATAGGEKLIQDSAGKMIAIYTDSSGRIGLAYDNSDPSLGGWSPPVKSSVPIAPYEWPAAVLVSPTLLRIIVEGGSGTGIISDTPVVIQRDSQNNITGFTIGTPTTLDSTGTGRYPAAILLHNGDIVAAWAWQNSTRTMVKSLRWDSSTGWTNLAGSSSTPDIALLDSVSITWFVPNMIERPDNNNVYLMANRFTGPPETIALNKATWNGSGWSWGSQNITYETNCSDADDDFVSVAWDPVRSMVVVAYGITGTLSYGVFTLNSQDVKTHNDTPSLAVTNRGWAGIAVHITTGDYYLFLMNVNADGGSGPLGYVRLPAGGAWNPTVNYLDSAATDKVISLRPTGTSPTIDLLYATGTSSPSTIKFTSVRPSNPSSFSISADPTIVTTQSGSSAASKITLASLSGFTGTISFSTNVSPSGLTASLNPSSIALTSGGTGSSTLTVSSTTSGMYTVTIVATSSSISHSVQVTVRVTDFLVSTPSSLTFTAGSTTMSTVTLTSLNGFAGTLALAPSASSPSVTSFLSPTSITLTSGSTSTSTLTVSSSTVGSYTVTVTGTSGSLSHAAIINVNVIAPSGFSVEANPSTVTFPAGSSGTSTITFTSLNRFQGSLTLSTSVAPSTGLTTSCTPTPVALTSGASAISICSFSSSTTGIYTVTVAATNGTLSHSTIIIVNVSEFSISATPTSPTILAGASGTSTVTLSSLNGFSGTVNLTLSSPAGITVSLSQTSLGLSIGGTVASTLSFNSATIGNYTLTVAGTSGPISHSIQVIVRVVDFAISSSSTSLTIFAGQSGISAVTLGSLGGFAGSIALTTSVSPSGLTASASPTTVSLTSGSSAASSLTVSSSMGGTYTLTVTGIAGSISHSVQITVRVADYTLSANPFTVGFQSGSNASSTINLTSLGGFSGNESLIESVAPSTGLTISCTPTNVSLSPGASANSTCTFTSSTQNTYTVTITATSGPLSHTTAITVEVGDFTISASPTTIAVQAGGPGSSSITLRSVAGFTGIINLSASVTPIGLTASLTPGSVSVSVGGSSSSALTVSSNTVGTYTVTIIGTSGSSTNSITLTINVQDFALAVNPSSLSLTAGSTGTVMVNIATLTGFTGTVSLSAVCTPSGPKLSLSSSSVSLNSGGSGTSTLTVHTFHKTPPGTYTIMITASSGSLTHTVTMILTVT